MAIKNIIARGIGFSAGSTRYIVTGGMSPVAPPAPSSPNATIVTQGFGTGQRMPTLGFGISVAPVFSAFGEQGYPQSGRVIIVPFIAPTRIRVSGGGRSVTASGGGRSVKVTGTGGR